MDVFAGGAPVGDASVGFRAGAVQHGASGFGPRAEWGHPERQRGSRSMIECELVQHQSIPGTGISPALNRQTDRHDVPAGGVGLPPVWVSGVGVREGARSGSPLPPFSLCSQRTGPHWLGSAVQGLNQGCQES